MCGCFEWPSNKRRSQNVIDGRRVSLLRSSNWSKRDTEIPKEALISNHLCKKRGRISVFCHHYSKLWGVLLKFIVTAAVENAAEVKDVWAEGTKKHEISILMKPNCCFPKRTYTAVYASNKKPTSKSHKQCSEQHQTSATVQNGEALMSRLPSAAQGWKCVIITPWKLNQSSYVSCLPVYNSYYRERTGKRTELIISNCTR